MTVSIIIAVATWQENLQRCVRECLALEFRDFEILILPDYPVDAVLDTTLAGFPESGINVQMIPTGPVSPALKRDIGMRHAKGGILAFIDDDAYPRKDWLNSALANFADPDVGAVGGPAITPPEDSFLQKVSGLIYESPLVSGAYIYRYVPTRKMEVDDFPSCNLLVRASCMKELGGFNTKFWPGEDTKLCLELVHTLKKKIVYDPGVLIYHHRRKAFLPHLAQVANYALHRGYFVKRLPQTSLKIAYFVPSIFVALLALGAAASAYSVALRPVYLFCIAAYALIIFISSLTNGLRIKLPPGKLLQKPFLITFSFIGIILTHLTYGIFLIKGILSPKLKEEL